MGQIRQPHRRVLGVVTAVALAMAGMSAASAATEGEVLDQSLAGDDGTLACSAETFPGQRAVATGESRQSFVPLGATLTSLEVCVQDIVGVPGDDITARIMTGTAASPGEVLATTSVDVGTDATAPQWLTIRFAGPVGLTPGETHVIGLEAAVGAPLLSFKWRASCGGSLTSSCDGVQDAYEDGTTNDLAANADYGFRTFRPRAVDLRADAVVDPILCPGIDLDGRGGGTVHNLGATPAEPFVAAWYLSDDDVLDVGDAPLVGGRTTVDGLAGGASVEVPLPTTLDTGAELLGGRHFVLLSADDDGEVDELDDGNDVAAVPVTITACGSPEIGELSLAADHDRVATGFRHLVAADLPLQDLARGLPRTAEEAADAVATSPVGFSPVGFSPVGFSPVGFSPVGFSPVGFSPVGFSPVGFSPVGFSPVGFSPLGGVLADVPSSVLERVLVIDVPIVSPGWEERLAGHLGDRPLQDVTLAEAVAALPDLRMQDVDMRAVLRMSWLSLALANGALDDVPVPGGRTWCDALAAEGFDCADAGLDPAVDSMLAAEAMGAPVRAVPIGDVPLSMTPSDPTWLVTSMPLTGSPRAHLEMTRLGALPVDVAVADPGTIATCDTFDCSRSLAEAATSGALRPVTVGHLLGSLTSVARDTTTVTDLALLVADLASLDLGDMRWETVDPVSVDPTCPTVPYRLHVENVGDAAVVDPDLVVELARGFGYVPGSLEVAVDGGDSFVVADPETSRQDDGAPIIRLSLEAIVEQSLDVTLRACAGVHLGFHRVGSATISSRTIDGRLERTTDPTGVGTVEVVERTEEDGPTDTPDTATEIGPNAVVALHLQSSDDTDHLKIAVPETADSLTIVRVFPPPAVDADVTAHGPAVSPVGFSPVGFSPVGFSPVGFSPVGFSPVGFSPVGFSPDEGSLVNGSEQATQPDTQDDVPTHLAPSDTTGLRAVAAHRGDQVETLYLRNHDGDEGVFTIGISGYNGARSDAPIIVTTQQIAPTPDPVLDQCTAAPWDLDEAPGSGPDPWVGPGEARTLFVTNRQVSTSLHGDSTTTAGIAALHRLAERPDVRGIVLEVDHSSDVRDAYAAWHDAWCSPAAANEVASLVRAQVLELRADNPGIDTVVIAGGDPVVPDFRLVDVSLLGNEVQYTDALVHATGGNNALVSAYAHGTIPSADPYGNERPMVYGQAFAFTPTAGVSRLVETPADWMLQVEQFEASNGLLSPEAGFVSGYDGMVDGARAAADALDADGISTFVLDDEDGPWSAADFRRDAMGAGADVAGFNAHSNHWALLSAAGSADSSTGSDEVVTSDELATSPFGGLLFSNGCHLGVQVDDGLRRDPTPEQARRILDWNQAATSGGGIAVANSGFGIFDTDVVGYGEQLQTMFVDALADAPNAAIALARAKARYLGSLGVYDAYQYKTVHQLSMFGLGVLRAFPDSGTTPPPPAPADAASIPVSTGDLQFASVDTDRGTLTRVVDHPTAVDTTPLSVNGHPVVPKLTLEVPLPAGRSSAGVWIDAITTVQQPDVDPVIARAAFSRRDRASESATFANLFPTTPAVAIDDGRLSRVTFPVGAFRAEGRSVGGQRRVLLLDTRIDGQLLLRDADTELRAPHVSRVSVARTTDGERLVIDVTADETFGPNTRAAALGLDDLGNWTYRELHRDVTGRWTGSIELVDGATGMDDLLVQVSNGRGVGYWRNKGEAPRVLDDLADAVAIELTSAAGQAANGTYRGDVVATVRGTPDVVYTVDDRGRRLGRLADGESVLVQGEGVHELRVVGSDRSFAWRSLTIDDSVPTIELSSPLDGSTHHRGDEVVLRVSCPDTGTGATCSTTVDGQPVADGDLLPTDELGEHVIVVVARDGADHETTLSRVYRVVPRYTMGAFQSPLLPLPGVHSVSRGATVPTKFTVADRNGRTVTDVGVVESVTFTRVTCSTGVATGSAVLAPWEGWGQNTRLHLNVAAPTTTGCFLLRVTLVDGTSQAARVNVT